MESKKEDTMQIKIQTFDNVFPLTIKRSASIQDLKDKIQECFNIPTAKQRLIFQGKLLQGTEKLKFYKISDDSVIHMVAKTLDESNTPQNQNETNNLNNNVTGTQTNESNDTRDELFPSFIEFPILRSRRQRRRRIPHFDISESFESMHQNISTIQNLMNCRNKFDEHQTIQSRTIVPFDFNRVRYEVGQWVDVKDTIDQWLEAQVIQVRNNQAYVHYNGWGTRWDEWIDFNSPRIAAFKTYTSQSPTTTFLSPYPSVPCDANVEPQPRSIDSFFYLEKSVGNINEISKIYEQMSKLRKRSLTKLGDVREAYLKEEKDKSHILKDDFVESKDKENQIKQTANPVNFNNGLNSNDYELLFNTTQLIPLLDRCGRMLCDLSLHLSHLVLNPSLYPQLLLGYNQNIEVSDTLSCTSGYSMYTNESSSITGLAGHQLEHNLLQNIRGNIQNSNQLIRNYNLNNPNISSNVNYSNTNTNPQQNQTTPQNQYNISGSSAELPFIQRLQNCQNQGVVSNQTAFTDSLPKINLQVPSLLSPGESLIQNGYNPFPEPNIDIYVHTLVSPNQNSTTTINNNNNNTNISSNNFSQNTTLNSIRNPIDRNPFIPSNLNNNQNLTSGGIQNLSLNSIINPNLFPNRSNSNVNTTTGSSINLINQESETLPRIQNSTTHQISGNSNNNTTNTQSNQSDIINNLLGNLMNIIGSSGNRRGSTASDSSNTSFQNPNTNYNLNSLLNTSPLLNTLNTAGNINSNNTVSNINSSTNRIVNSTQSLNNLQTRVNNQANSANNSVYKETSSQTDMTLNLLSLNKDNTYNDHMIEISSNKSDKNFSLKNKNTVSYKSLSEISEFEQYDVEEPSEYVIRTKKQDKSVGQNSKHNESIHSSTSHISKDCDDKDENENYRKHNK